MNIFYLQIINIVKYSLIKSDLFWAKFHKSNFLKLILEHCCEFEEPKVMWGNFTIDFQHITIHHQYIPY